VHPGPRRLAVAHVGVALVLSAAVVVLHVTTMLAIQRLNPEYPRKVTLNVFAPPSPFVTAHTLFPPAFVLGTLVIGGVAYRVARGDPPSRRKQIAALAFHVSFLLPFLLVFLWAALWSRNVFALIERSRG